MMSDRQRPGAGSLPHEHFSGCRPSNFYIEEREALRTVFRALDVENGGHLDRLHP
jgi:hypothetical protein